MRQHRAVTIVGLVILAWLASATAGSAQPPAVLVNPTIVQFTPSADHAAIGLDGQALVTRYELRVYTAAAPGVVVSAVDLAKPTPGTDGTIQVAIPPALKTAVLATAARNVLLIARVAAIGPQGEGVSDPTDPAVDPFGYAGPPAAPTGVKPKK